MRKYMAITKTFLNAQIIWRADALLRALFVVSKILFAYILWGTIFQQQELVSGFTFSMMLSYYLLTAFLSELDVSAAVSREISQRVKNGTFSKYMVLPVNVQGYFIAQSVGTMLFYGVFNLMASILWIFLFKIELAVTASIACILPAVMMVAMGLLFMIQFHYFLGLLAFRFHEIEFFLMIKDTVLTFVTGALVPLALLPEAVLGGLKILPFYYVTYLPSMLFMGRNQGEALSGLGILAIWMLIMAWVNRRSYQIMRLKYDGVGI